MSSLPRTLDDFKADSWDDVAPYVEDLLARELNAGNVAAWLADWSQLEKLLRDTVATRTIAYHLDTASEEKEARLNAFYTGIYPQAQVAQHRLKEKLVALGYAPPPEHAVFMRSFEKDVALFREENVPLLAEEQQLGMEYDRIMGAMTVEFDGEEKTIPQVYAYQQKTDRAVREAAWRAIRARQMQDRAALHDLFDRMVKLRHQVARNAGFANYRDYQFHTLGRFDYTPEDCKAFHTAIEKVIVPVVARLNDKRRQQMGLNSLRPWDTRVDPLGREPLTPFDAVDTLITRSIHIFSQVDKTLGHQFATMADEGLLELDSRKGKAPGGYCEDLQLRQRPFIFMNAVGMHNDVQTLLHEGGHAFHSFETTRLPLIWQGAIPMEIAEVASMTMELLAAPYLTAFYDDADMKRARVEHLEDTIKFLPYMAVVDAFQHWLYENPDHSRAERDAKWAELIHRFQPDIDWSGLESELESFWMRQGHIYGVPFYYVEYGIAQVGAWQIWRNSLHAPAQALAQYRETLALGYTRPLPELFATAGAVFKAFTDEHLLGELVALIEQQINQLEGAS